MLNLKAGRYEDLLQKADEKKLMNGSEVDKWRKRTTELLQNEQKLKAELDEVKRENRMKEQQNQCTQTEVRYINILYK
jgi:pantothenate kinase-related protein Tda10